MSEFSLSDEIEDGIETNLRLAASGEEVKERNLTSPH
jgi:hypothetical protein